MESLVRLLDEADDIIIAAALRLQRAFSPKPRERRTFPRRGIAARSAPVAGNPQPIDRRVRAS